MCNPKEQTFSCGHKELSIAEEGQLTHRRKEEFPTRPANIRRISTTVIEPVSLPKPCKQKYGRKEALESLSRQYTKANVKIKKLSERAELVSNAASRADPPKASRFSGLGEQGWDAQKLEKLCSSSLTDCRNLLAVYPRARDRALKELEIASSAAKASVYHHTLTTASSMTAEIVNFDATPLEELGVALSVQMHDLVCEIERRASVACLEKFGWEVPEEDSEQCKVLSDFAGWKRGMTSGSRMDDAYVRTVSRQGAFEEVEITTTW